MAFKSMLRVTLGPVLAIMVTLAANVAPAAAEPYRIVGVGDSLMAGYDLGAGEGFPARLEAALKARGHDVSRLRPFGMSGCATAVMIDPATGNRFAGADPRRDCYAIAY